MKGETRWLVLGAVTGVVLGAMLLMLVMGLITLAILWGLFA